MKCLITGASGFLGKNLYFFLKQAGYDVLTYHHEESKEVMEKKCKQCDIVFHLAGVNRPQQLTEFDIGNVGFTKNIVDALKKVGNACPIVFASSIQATKNNPYGQSKLQAEKILLDYAENLGGGIRIYRLPNVFGKWCRPNYNSVIATFCYNRARDLPLVVHDELSLLELVYVDDVMSDFIHCLEDDFDSKKYYANISVTYRKKLGEIADMIRLFGDCHAQLQVPDQLDDFSRKMYSTYLSYLPECGRIYSLDMHMDDRGSFTEVMRTLGQGQFSVNISHPGIVKGNHWHHTKHEKFLVISGEGIIRLRNVWEKEIITYHVLGEKLEIVEIPPGYTHNIENIGNQDMVTLMWANENFNPDKPDTWYMEV